MEVILDGIAFPEGPAFDGVGGIWLVEKEGENLIYVKGGIATRHAVGGAPNGIAIDSKGTVWFCDSLKNAIRTFNPKDGVCITVVDALADGQTLKMPNDLAFDRLGNLVFTCPGDSLEDGEGYICCFGEDGILSVIHKGMYYPNGLAFSADQKTLFIAETGTHVIWAFEWDGVVKKASGGKKWAYVGGPIGPDGIALDDEGCMYVAVYGSGLIKKVDSTGKVIEEMSLPGLNPTNCALDKLGKGGLMVTEAQKGQLLRIPREEVGIL